MDLLPYEPVLWRPQDSLGQTYSNVHIELGNVRWWLASKLAFKTGEVECEVNQSRKTLRLMVSREIPI